MQKKQSQILKKGGVISKEAIHKVKKSISGGARSKKQGASKGSSETKAKKSTAALPDHHFKAVKVKRGLAGLGLFAGEDIKKGDLIVEYIGNILNKEEAENIKTNQYLFEVNRNKTIDGSVRWNTARYCNHSCDGNAESEIKKGRVFIQAIKNIQAGEEILYDYGEEFVKEYISPYGCRCSSEKHLYGAEGDE